MGIWDIMVIIVALLSGTLVALLPIMIEMYAAAALVARVCAAEAPVAESKGLFT